MPSNLPIGIVAQNIKYIESFVNSSNPAIYAMTAIAKFAIIAHVTIQATCHSVISVKRYIPCRFAARSGLAFVSNSNMPNHRKPPLDNNVKSSGSHAIGNGLPRCMSFLSPYWYRLQNFVLISIPNL